MTTEKVGRSTIELMGIDEDYEYRNYIRIHAVLFVPGAINDRLVIRDKLTPNTPAFFDALAIDEGTYIIYLNGITMKPFIDFSECTLSSGHRVILQTRSIFLWQDEG